MKTIQKLILISTIALTTLSTQAATYKFMIQDTNVTSSTFIGDSGSETEVVVPEPSTQFDNLNWLDIDVGVAATYGNFGYYSDMTDCSFSSGTNEIRLSDNDMQWSTLYVSTIYNYWTNDFGISTDSNGKDYFFIDINKNTVRDANENETYYIGEFDSYSGGDMAYKFALCKY